MQFQVKNECKMNKNKAFRSCTIKYLTKTTTYKPCRAKKKLWIT